MCTVTITTLDIQLCYRVDEQLHIKVADFGLARDVYMTDYYRQKGTGKIPAKWMAPESLHDRISNEKTDVVSYLTRAHIAALYAYSGHMGSHVGRCSVLAVLPIPPYLITKY